MNRCKSVVLSSAVALMLSALGSAAGAATPANDNPYARTQQEVIERREVVRFVSTLRIEIDELAERLHLRVDHNLATPAQLRELGVLRTRFERMLLRIEAQPALDRATEQRAWQLLRQIENSIPSE